jgi:hypothetical protein
VTGIESVSDPAERKVEILELILVRSEAPSAREGMLELDDEDSPDWFRRWPDGRDRRFSAERVGVEGKTGVGGSDPTRSGMAGVDEEEASVATGASAMGSRLRGGTAFLADRRMGTAFLCNLFGAGTTGLAGILEGPA